MSYALITGASGGIGHSIALELAAKGYGLVLVARNAQALETLSRQAQELSKKESHFLATDLSQPGAADAVASFCKERNVEPSILVNNAGYGLWGDFDKLTLESQLNMMQLNMNTLVELCHHMLPVLRRQPQAYILNIASTAAYQAVPAMSVYAATKVFVLYFSRGLRHELRKTNVSVTVVSPGPVSTGFMNRAGMKEPWLVERSERFAMTPDAVASAAIQAMFRRKAEVVPGFLNSFAATLTGFAPKSLAEKIAASLYEK